MRRLRRLLDGAPDRHRWSANRLATLVVVLINLPIILLVVHMYIAPIGTLIGLAPTPPAAGEGAAPVKTE